MCMVYHGKNSWASKYENASKTITLPIKTWAKLQELSNMLEKPLPIVLMRAVNDMWEFKKDLQRMKESKMLENGLLKPETSLK